MLVVAVDMVTRPLAELVVRGVVAQVTGLKLHVVLLLGLLTLAAAVVVSLEMI
jgi:hypothetical protein